MAKTHSWAPRAPEILARVAASSRQSWRRIDIERLFEVKRATAQTLMKLIGGLHLVGATHLVDRSSLLSFLEEVLETPTVGEGVARRWLAAEPAPDRRGLRQLHTALPVDLHSIMARDLPSNSSPARSSSPAPTRPRSSNTSACSPRLSRMTSRRFKPCSTLRRRRPRSSRTSSAPCSPASAKTNTPGNLHTSRDEVRGGAYLPPGSCTAPEEAAQFVAAASPPAARGGPCQALL